MRLKALAEIYTMHSFTLLYRIKKIQEFCQKMLYLVYYFSNIFLPKLLIFQSEFMGGDLDEMIDFRIT